MGPAEEIETLKTLSQQAAAVLLGMTARALRDRPDVPRNPDGTYNAPELVEWAKRKLPRPDLADEELEEVFIVCEALYSGASEAWGAVSDWLRDFYERFGDPGYAFVLETMLTEFRDLAAAAGAGRARRGHPPTWPEWIEQFRGAFNAEVQAWDRTAIDIATVCAGCGRVRRGRKWVQTPPAVGYSVQTGKCPECSSGQAPPRRR